MSEALFYVVGASDVEINGKKRFQNYYEATRNLWEQFNRKKHKVIKDGFVFTVSNEITLKFWRGDEIISGKVTIEFPLVISVIEHIRKQSSRFGQKDKDRVFIFVTEQNPTHKSDTKFAGLLIGELLKERFRMLPEVIKIIEIKENPAHYEKMAQFFKNFIENVKEEIQYKAVNYVSLTTGTPAEIVNLALVMNEFPVEYLYLVENEGITVPEIFKKLSTEKQKEVIKTLLRHHDYSGTLEVLKKSPFRYVREIEDITNMLVKRWECNFKESFELVKDIDFPRKTEVSDLAEGDIKSVFREMFYVMEIYFRKKQYVEALSQLFSLVDNLLQFLVERITGVRIQKEKGEFKKYNEFIETQEELRKYLEDEDINWKNNPSTLALTHILKWYNKEICFVGFVEKIQGLLEIRNTGRLAHGYSPVSKEIIEKKYKGSIPELLEELRECMKKIGIPVEENFYDAINVYLIEKLDVL